MQAEPLSKTIYDKAKSLGIEKILLKFSGGSDEGFLYVECEPHDKCSSDFEKEIEDWAWEVYSYNGAGDGTDYGDNIEYDLENGKVKTSEWYHVIHEEDNGEDEIKISDEEDKA